MFVYGAMGFNVRDPNASRVVGMLDIKNNVSVTHKAISNWLKALLILGLCNKNMATQFPRQPRIMRRDDTTPAIQNFHLTRI